MTKKKPSLRTFKKMKADARQKLRRKEALEKVKLSMSDAELEQLARESEKILTRRKAQAIIAARRKAEQWRNSAHVQVQKESELGCFPPVSGDHAHPDWWRED